MMIGKLLFAIWLATNAMATGLLLHVYIAIKLPVTEGVRRLDL